MVYAALAFLAAYCGLFLWLIIKAFRAETLFGLWWSATKADRPAIYWSGVAVYLLNLVLGLIFLLLVATANAP